MQNINSQYQQRILVSKTRSKPENAVIWKPEIDGPKNEKWLLIGIYKGSSTKYSICIYIHTYIYIYIYISKFKTR